MCPRRNGDAILALFLGTLDKPASPAAFYRVWTFGEAFFKVFGRPPGAETLAHVLEHHSDDGSYRVALPERGAVGVLHSKPFDDFALTIAWDMADTASGPKPCLKRTCKGLVGATGFEPVTL